MYSAKMNSIKQQLSKRGKEKKEEKKKPTES